MAIDDKITQEDVSKALSKLKINIKRNENATDPLGHQAYICYLYAHKFISEEFRTKKYKEISNQYQLFSDIGD